ncbi:MAG: endonuclease/exonuclease/phosphatase family protein [Actinomycetes bacterium]
MATSGTTGRTGPEDTSGRTDPTDGGQVAVAGALVRAPGRPRGAAAVPGPEGARARAVTAARSRAGGTVAVALATVVGLELVRVWLPSVVFVYGRAGSTPATEMGAFALGLVTAAVVAGALTVRLGPARLATAMLAVALLARLVLQGGPGGGVQLTAASVGAVAWTVWLGALAGGALPRRLVARGLALGLVVDVALRGMLATAEPVWTAGAAGWLVALALVVATGASWRDAVARRGPRVAPDGGAAIWLALGPVLLLWGVVAGLPSRLVTLDGLPVWLAAAVLVGAASLALGGLPALASRHPRSVAGVAAGGGLVTIATGVDGATVPATVTAAALLVLLGGALAGLAASSRPPRRAGDGRPRGRSRAAAGGAGGVLALTVLGFVLYASYDVDLGVDPATLLRVAVLLTVPALVPLVRRRVVDLTHADTDAVPPGAHAERRLVAAGAGVLVLATAAGGALASAPAAPPPSTLTAGEPALRVHLHNVHMGIDTRGRFVPAELAAVVRTERPDVVVLNEVDRGWLLQGGHDLLGLLAARIGLPHVAFAPAADEVWGNAVLSRWPISSESVVTLPVGGVPMRRSALEVTIASPHGDVVLLATHLHHLDDEPDVRLAQARAVAELVAARDGTPVIVAGDLNAQPGDPELAPLEALVADLTGRPDPTFPSWDPQWRIDHVLGTPGLTGVDATVPRSEASDHLGVAVTVRLP